MGPYARWERNSTFISTPLTLCTTPTKRSTDESSMHPHQVCSRALPVHCFGRQWGHNCGGQRQDEHHKWFLQRQPSMAALPNRQSVILFDPGQHVLAEPCWYWVWSKRQMQSCTSAKVDENNFDGSNAKRAGYRSQQPPTCRNLIADDHENGGRILIV